jgi:arylsulfatase
MEDPDANWEERLFISHKTRWGSPAKYGHSAIRDARWKLVFPANELYDLENDIRETDNVADEHPEIAAKLKTEYDAWWDDIQPFLVNDNLQDKPKTHKPYHELYREQLGEERFQEAMRLMTWSGGKPYGKKKRKRGR